MEQSYKEKYEKALEKIKNLIDKDHNDINVDDVLNIFPELAESEDEKAIKEIIELVMQPTWKTEEEFHRRNVLCAWLENVPVTIDHEKREGFHLGYKACLEKQGEKLPAGFYYVNSEGKKFYSDTFKYGDVILHVEKQGEQKSQRTISAEAKEAMYDKPAEWSEEDERRLNTIIHNVTIDKSMCKYEVAKSICDEQINWLKSIKDRVQPQNRWKPSDEQMGCLSDAIEHYNSLGYPASKLKELLDDLKKLNGGEI